jgi:hypothetical protein
MVVQKTFAVTLEQTCAGWTRWAALAVLQLLALPAWSAGTVAGTVIDNTAVVNFDFGGTPTTQNSNTVSLTVAERIDVIVTLQSGQVLVAPNDFNRSILYTVTNTGSGMAGHGAKQAVNGRS